MIDYQVFIDFQHPEMIRVPVVQGDTESRRITFVMYNGAADYNPQSDLDTVLTVALSYLKPDGTGGQYDTMPDGETPAGNLSGNVCVLRLAPQTMSAAGLVLCNLVLFDTQGVTLQTFPFVLDVKRSAGMEITSQDYYNVQTIEGVSQSLMHMVQSVNNATPDQHGNVSLLPWQLPYNGVVGGQQVGDVEEALDMLARMQAEIISQEIKDALINCFEHVAWTDEHGQDYVDALEQAMRSKLISISAVFTQGSAVIYDTDDLDTLRQYLTVTANYSDTTTRTVTAYTLSGTLTAGTSTITVSYGGKTATFEVTVTHKLSLDDVAYGSMTYRDIFVTNNLWYLSDFEGNITLSNTVQRYEGDSNKNYKINAGTPTISQEAYNSASHSLKAFGSVSTQIQASRGGVSLPVGQYLICAAVNCTRYSAGKLGIQWNSPINGTVDRITVAKESVTNGFEAVADILTTTVSSNDFTSYVGSMSSANLDGYVDDVVITPLPSGMTLEQGLALYENYLAIRRGA